MTFRTFLLYVSVAACIGLAFVAGFLSYPTLHPLLTSALVDSDRQWMVESPMVPVADPMDMTVFWQVNQILDRDFYGVKPDLQARRYGAIQGLVNSFGDLYTRYEPPIQSAGSGAALCGCEGVIGVEIDKTDAGFVLHPQPDLPAQQAGILDGDLLIQVDDTVITIPMTIDEIFQQINGAPRSPVIIVVQRQSADQTTIETLNFQMTRVEIITPSMEWRMLAEDNAGNIGYIRHMQFTNHSVEEMQQALTELLAQGADRFILDLRNNPGGPVDAALAITDMWLDEGVMLIEEDANGEEKRFDATAGQVADGAPLVIMVDHGTASASEIVAGALRDYNRATLVGAQTYGKGSVQLRHELADQSSLYVTNAMWFTPQRYQITRVGLLPDLIVDDSVDALPLAIASVQQLSVAQR